MNRLGHTSIWFPNYVVSSVLEIDAAELKRCGITHIAFDLDDTLLPRGRFEITDKYQEFVRSLQEGGLTVLVATNTRRNIGFVETIPGITVVRPAGFSMKPFASFYQRVIAKAGVGPHQIAMVGNHYVNDIFGANRAGLISILTKSVVG